MGKPELSELPLWVFTLYDFSHSLVIAIIFILIAFKINKDFCFPMLAWPFHIILDFLHRESFSQHLYFGLFLIIVLMVFRGPIHIFFLATIFV